MTNPSKSQTTPGPVADLRPAFSKTRWSLVLDLNHPHGELADRSLRELSERYWYPVYAYARRSGHGAPIANDLCLAFFAYLPGVIASLDPRSHGRFRDFLLEQLNVFLTEDWRKYCDEATQQRLTPPVAFEALEARLSRDHATLSSPTQAYHRSFALEVLNRSLQRLHDEAAQSGRSDMFRLLQPFLTSEPVPGQYEELSKQLGTPPLVLAVAIKRLRQRFRELADEELTETVTNPADLDNERATLTALIAGQGP
jgi:RNA polymerase sigma-70 factor (ECF subfamily)